MQTSVIEILLCDKFWSQYHANWLVKPYNPAAWAMSTRKPYEHVAWFISWSTHIHLWVWKKSHTSLLQDWFAGRCMQLWVHKNLMSLLRDSYADGCMQIYQYNHQQSEICCDFSATDYSDLTVRPSPEKPKVTIYFEWPICTWGRLSPRNVKTISAVQIIPNINIYII